MTKLRYPKLFLDTETTGLNPSVSDVVQVFACVPSQGVSINIEMRPRDDAVIEEKALECNGLSIDDLYKRTVTQQQGAIQLAQFIKEHIRGRANTVAHNAPFDKAMVEHWFARTKMNFGLSFHFRWIDTMTVTMFLADRGVIKRPKDYKLITLARHFGIEFREEDLHEAGEDVRLTVELFAVLDKLMAPIKLSK